MKVQIRLAPSYRQRSILDSLFSGPETLKEMLEIDRPNVNGDADLSRYLQKHRHELYKSMGAKSWEYCVDFLMDVGRKHLAEGKAAIEAGPVPDCSISSDNKVYVPLTGLNLIASNNPAGVGKIRKEWQSKGMQYVSKFLLVKSNGEYHCEFALVKTESPTSARPVGKKSGSKRARVMSIAKLCNLIANAELSNSRAYARVDFDDLQGQSVPGGAVELGKKR